MKFVVASMNPDKLRELEVLLASEQFSLVSLRDFPGAEPPEECGATLVENARIKARAAVRLTGLPAIADDTGLEVDALGGQPGLHTSRYAGPGASYADNVVRLLTELRGVPAERRTARFRCACVACFPDGAEAVGEGLLEGRITEQPRGRDGFGYDPVFELPDLGRTLAELPAREKNQCSHRARAARNLMAALERLRR
jgi:XTP/dITP diphosphohydrolase